MFLSLGLQCYNIYNAEVARTEFWKVKATILRLAVITVAVWSPYFSVLKNSRVNVFVGREQTEGTLLTYIAWCEWLVSFYSLDKVCMALIST